jgi:uncharacterized RDD family membrane protein YckC
MGRIDMTCAYCGTRNGDGEHRCGRCGRRPDDTLTAEAAVHRTHGQLAMKVEATTQDSGPPSRPIGRAYQPFLFQPASNVIPIAQYIPVEPRPRASRGGSGTAPPPKRAPRKRHVPEEQGTLDFLAPAPPKPRTLSTTVEAVIFCDAPVAVRLHRAVAAALDWSMVLIAYGIFLFAFSRMGGSFTLNKANLLMFGAVLLVFGFAYGLTFALAGTETAGMHWTRLKLLTFEGFPPEKRQRLIRFFGSALSVCTLIGLMWSLVDEEGLGWQDHMSRTFPTPREADSLTLVQK